VQVRVICKTWTDVADVIYIALFRSHKTAEQFPNGDSTRAHWVAVDLRTSFVAGFYHTMFDRSGENGMSVNKDSESIV